MSTHRKTTPPDKNQLYIRIFSLICLILVLAAMAIKFFNNRTAANSSNTLEQYISLYNRVLACTLFFLLVIRPQWWGILVFGAFLEGCITLYSGDHSFGFFLYLFGLFIALRFGVYARHLKRRLLISLLPLVLTVLSLFFKYPSDAPYVVVILCFEIGCFFLIFLLSKTYIEDLLPPTVKLNWQLPETYTNKSLNLGAAGL